MPKSTNIISDPTGFYTVKTKPSSEELNNYYNNYLMNNSKCPKNYQDHYNKKEIEFIQLRNDLCLHAIEMIRPLWKKHKNMLDIGVGEGFTTSYFLKNEWNVHGIDFSDFAAKKFNPHITKNLKVGDALKILKDYVESNMKFDVCVLNNVLEHVIEPRELLETTRQLLSQDGLAIITVPNDFSILQTKALELGFVENEFWVDTPEHLNYFNTSNIKNLMNEMNFKILDIFSTFPIDFFLFHNNSNYIKNEYNGKPAHRARVELEILISQAGIENYHKLCQSFASCNVGRNFSIIVEACR